MEAKRPSYADRLGRAEWALGRAHLAPLADLVGVGRLPLAGTRPAPSFDDRQSASERLRRHACQRVPKIRSYADEARRRSLTNCTFSKLRSPARFKKALAHSATPPFQKVALGFVRIASFHGAGHFHPHPGGVRVTPAAPTTLDFVQEAPAPGAQPLFPTPTSQPGPREHRMPHVPCSCSCAH